MRFSIDEDDEPASCCKPKHLPDDDGDHSDDQGDEDEGDGGGTLRSGGKGGTFK